MTSWFAMSGIKNYSGMEPLEGVPGELASMRSALTDLGLSEVAAFDTEDRSHDSLREQLADWAAEKHTGVDETLVIYCTGHGFNTRGGKFRLLRCEAKTGFRPQELLEAVSGRASLSQIVLILDACFSESGADAIVAEGREPLSESSQKEIWAIASSRRLEIAKQQAFADAFIAAMRQESRPSFSAAFLDFHRLVAHADKKLGNQSVWLNEAHSTRGCRAFPNPAHQRRRLDHAALPIRPDWVAAARGVTSAAHPGFFFTGRESELCALRDHLAGLTDDDNIMVVTGHQGVGKSALLGQLVLTAVGTDQLPFIVRRKWPPLQIPILAIQGDIQTTLQILDERLGDSRISLLEQPTSTRTFTDQMAIVVDGWDTLDSYALKRLVRLRNPERRRIVVGTRRIGALGATSGLSIIDLDRLESDSSAAVHKYLQVRHKLATPRSEEAARTFADRVIAAGPGFRVAAAGADTYALTVERGVDPADAYTLAENEARNSAHRLCRDILFPNLGSRAGTVIDVLSSLSSYDDTVTLAAPEWAVVASRSAGEPVTANEITSAAAQLGVFVTAVPGTDAKIRWRAKFRPTAELDAQQSSQAAHRFLSYLPQMDRYRPVGWSSLEPAMHPLVAIAATIDFGHGRLIDDPEFLLGAPHELLSAAIRHLPLPERRRWVLIGKGLRLTNSIADRALMLAVVARRVGLSALGADPAVQRHFRYRVGWTQPSRRPQESLTRMVLDNSGVLAVSVDANDVIEFWSTRTGSALRPRVKIAGVPYSLGIARTPDGIFALVSTWQGHIWAVCCERDEDPRDRADLVPPTDHRGPVEIHVAPRDGGQVVVGCGDQVWISDSFAIGAPRRAVPLDFDLFAIRGGGAIDSSWVWLIGTTGRVRRLRLDGTVNNALGFFPMSRRPLYAAGSTEGTHLLLADVAGRVFLRGLADLDEPLQIDRTREVGALAVNADIAAVGGGPSADRGWLQLYSLRHRQILDELPLDATPVALGLTPDGGVVVAQPSGLWMLQLNEALSASTNLAYTECPQGDTNDG